MYIYKRLTGSFYWFLSFIKQTKSFEELGKYPCKLSRNKSVNDFVVCVFQDVQYADIDHMDERKDFTIDPVNFNGLREYFNELRSQGMRTIIILVGCHGYHL